jgi:cytoskeletal protein RodZ
MSERSDGGSVGARLKQVRESKRVTLRQIANTTRIAMSALDAIERDDVKKLPGGIFARSFVRAYASELKLDVEQTVADFFAQFPESADTVAASSVEQADGSRPWPVPTAIARGVMLAIPTLALVGWMVFGSRGVTPREDPPLASARIPAERPDARVPAPARAVPDVVPAGGALPLGPRASTDGAMTLHLTTQGECWVSITADGREVVSRLMIAGEEEAVRAVSELRIKVGDAGVVGLRINGSALRPLGRPGQVVTLRVDTTNLADLLETR